jgi:hypothetical protein
MEPHSSQISRAPLPWYFAAAYEGCDCLRYIRADRADRDHPAPCGRGAGWVARTIAWIRAVTPREQVFREIEQHPKIVRIS